ncbi:MAG: NIPSNAP family protein, partial [Geminicoccaceae bacterium]
IHVWAYEDAADRAKRRAAMQADPDWQAFLKKSAEAGNLIAQENQILTPPSFFDLKREAGSLLDKAGPSLPRTSKFKQCRHARRSAWYDGDFTQPEDAPVVPKQWMIPLAKNP